MRQRALPTTEDVGELFRQHERGLIRGAFIRVTPRKVEGWKARNMLHAIWIDGRLAGAFVMARVVSRQAIRDFSGTIRTELQRGDLFVKRLACCPGDEHRIADVLREMAPAKQRLWLRIWQEHPLDRRIVEALDGYWVCTKILSGSELVGIWCARQRAEIRDLPRSENWTLRRLSIGPVQVEKARKAVLRKYPDFITHYSTKYNSSNSWSAFSLRSYGGAPDFIMKPAEMPKQWKRRNLEKLLWELKDTSKRKILPEFDLLINAVPGIKHRIRIMRLVAGGCIERHSDVIDRETGTAPGKTLRIHLPIATNAKVRFTSWDVSGRRQSVHMKEGEFWYVDTRKPHQVENEGDADRLHLVMDVVSCSELLSAIDRSRRTPDFGKR
jgi:hypothetical protein